MFGIYDNGEIIAQFAAPMTMRSNAPVFLSDSLSLKRKAKYRGSQRWELETNLEPLSHGGNQLMVNMVVNNYNNTVDIVIPQNIGVMKERVEATLGPVATGSQYASTVNIASTNPEAYIPAGQFLKFSNHSKIYMVTEGLSGNGTLHVYPPLVIELPADPPTNIYIDGVRMACYYDTETVIGMSYTDGILMDNGSIKLIEAL